MANPTKITDTEALNYHKQGSKPGKISMTPSKVLMTQRDLSLAYSPGVAVPCREIAKDESAAYEYTSKGNMVAVISNGTAVLGLGNLGALASKPVMEGKAVLFKKFADIDAIDLEVDTQDVDKFVDSVKYLGASWGGINLEDIKSPECFIIEDKLKEIMDIPVFHDDQHGTAIITAAGLINAVDIVNKDLKKVKIVSNGAGAASIACVELLKDLGVPRNNIILCDRSGVIYKGRKEGMNPWKEKYAVETKHRTLMDAIHESDVFLGLSAKGALSKDMVKSMAKDPIIFAMANPDPEILPEQVREVRQDAIVATGRSDYNNQVNNVMGFPYIFRGALDVRAKTINQEMKIAAAKAIAELARKPVPEAVYNAYLGKKMSYGRDYIIPVPFDPRLIVTVPVAVAEAAINSGVARKTNFDLAKYREELENKFSPVPNYMNSVFEKISNQPQRLVFAEGETYEVIKAAIIMKKRGHCKPVLVGRASKIEPIVSELGEDFSLDGVEITNSSISKNTNKYIDYLYSRLQRKGYLLKDCKRILKSDKNIFAASMVACNDGDALVAGGNKDYYSCYDDIIKAIDPIKDRLIFSYSIASIKDRTVIIADCSINKEPSALQLAQIATGASKIVKKIGHKPQVAFLSWASFGNSLDNSDNRIKEAIKILDNKEVDFHYDGEMSLDVALSEDMLKLYPFCRLKGPSNILVMPSLDSASVATKLLKLLKPDSFIGPLLTGAFVPVQILPLNCSTKDAISLGSFACLESIVKKKYSS